MDTVALDRSTIRIPRMGLGGSPWGREIDEPTSRDVLDYALEQGITLPDSGESCDGESPTATGLRNSGSTTSAR